MRSVPMMSVIMAGALGITTILSGCSTGSDNEINQPELEVKKSEIPNAPELQLTTDNVTEEEVIEQKKSVMKKIDYYEEPTQKQEEKPKEEPKAIDILRKIAADRGWKVKLDINDSNFRLFVYSVAANAQSLTEQEANVINIYVKYVDQYENKLKNKRIKELEEKLKKGIALSKAELAELQSLLPIHKGIKLDPNIDTETPKDKTEGKPKTPENEEQSPEDKEDDSNSGEEEKEEKKPEPKDPKDPKEDENKEDPGQEDDENKDEDESEEDQDEDQDQKEDPPANEGKYDAKTAVEYAYKWWNKRNNKEYGYYSKVMKCEDCWADCTNFVSQVIQKAGIDEVKTGDSYWYYSDKKPSLSWGVANAFYRHFVNRAEQAHSKKDISVGDIVSVDFNNDGDIEHSAVITKKEDGLLFATYHSNDRKDALINYWLDQYDVYVFKMGTVK